MHVARCLECGQHAGQLLVVAGGGRHPDVDDRATNPALAGTRPITVAGGSRARSCHDIGHVQVVDVQGGRSRHCGGVGGVLGLAAFRVDAPTVEYQREHAEEHHEGQSEQDDDLPAFGFAGSDASHDRAPQCVTTKVACALNGTEATPRKEAESTWKG